MSLTIGQSYSKLKSSVFKFEGECVTTLSQMSHNFKTNDKSKLHPIILDPKTNVMSLKRLTWGLIHSHPNPHG